MFWYFFFPSIILISTYYRNILLLNCFNIFNYFRQEYLKYKPTINTILITNNKNYQNANISNLINHYKRDINGIIINGTNRGIIFSKHDIQQKINELENKYSSILSATLINDTQNIDITNYISKYIYQKHNLSYEKIVLLLNYHKLNYNNNSSIQIMDNNMNQYEVILKDKPNIKVSDETNDQLLHIYFT